MNNNNTINNKYDNNNNSNNNKILHSRFPKTFIINPRTLSHLSLAILHFTLQNLLATKGYAY